MENVVCQVYCYPNYRGPVRRRSGRNRNRYCPRCGCAVIVGCDESYSVRLARLRGRGCEAELAVRRITAGLIEACIRGNAGCCQRHAIAGVGVAPANCERQSVAGLDRLRARHVDYRRPIARPSGGHSNLQRPGNSSSVIVDRCKRNRIDLSGLCR